jgi:class 3 adenylate cyclase
VAVCAAANGGEILVSDRFLTAIESLVEAETVGELELKGFRRPVMTHRVLRLRQ